MSFVRTDQNRAYCGKCAIINCISEKVAIQFLLNAWQ